MVKYIPTELLHQWSIECANLENILSQLSVSPVSKHHSDLSPQKFWGVLVQAIQETAAGSSSPLWRMWCSIQLGSCHGLQKGGIGTAETHWSWRYCSIGKISKLTSLVYKRVAEIIAGRRQTSYPETMALICCRPPDCCNIFNISWRYYRGQVKQKLVVKEAKDNQSSLIADL